MTILIAEPPSAAEDPRRRRPDDVAPRAAESRQRPLEVAVASDSPVIRMGVAALLTPYSRRVRTTGVDLASAGTAHADVLLVDPGACVCAALRVAAHPGTAAVLLYGRQLPPGQLRRAIAGGCAGSVDLGSSAVELVQALESATCPEGRIGAERRWPRAEHGLSPRESDVLRMISLGLTNDDIVTRTGLSPNTVKSYIRNAYRKAGLTRRSEAVRWGIEHGLAPRAGTLPL